MDEKTTQLIKKYVDIVLARKTLIVSFVFLSVLVGLFVFYKTPKVYQAKALLIYEKQKVNPSKMSPDIEARTKEIVSTLMQQVTSRTNLEKVIKEYNLYVGMREVLPLEDVIEAMRNKILISPTKGDVFEVSFEGSDPRKVLRVTNALASKFIEENLKYREERATETSNYIANELSLAKQSLDKKEQAMRDYKLEHYNEMPQQREINVARLNTLQVKLQGVQDNIQDLERTKIILQEQIGARRRALEAITGSQMLPDQAPLAGGKQQEKLDPYQRLAQLQAYESGLLVKYKPTHPEIKRVRKAISALESQLGASDELPAEPNQGGGNLRSIAGRDPVLQQAALQWKDIELNLIELRKDEAELRGQIQNLNGWIAAAPIREAEWTALTRDYNEFKKHYDFLVAQNLQAVSVQNLERKQQGSQFKIMDPARLPEKPVKPDFLKIMVLALGLGFAMGGGIALGLDLVDTTFTDPLEIEEYLGLGVTCSIPFIPLPREKRAARLRKVVFYLYLLFGVIAIGGIVFFLWKSGILIL